MFYFTQQSVSKPNRFDNDLSDKEYHLEYGKFALTDSGNSLHQSFIANVKLNKKFYKGDQWIYKEDVESFLKDSTNQERNRIRVVHNLIRPMIEQYRGNAIRLTINAAAKSVSKKAINRREESLGRQILVTNIAQEFPNLGNAIKAADQSIGDSEKETRTIHENLYVDSYVKVINRLIRYVGEINDLPEKQVRVAQNLGLSGLAVIEGFEHGAHQRYEVVESEEFFFDRSAKKYDLSDSDYMGKVPGMLPTDIYESYPNINDSERKAIEKYVSDRHRQTNNIPITDTIEINNYGNTKVPVCHAYWRDQEKKVAGYVYDEYGYPYLVYLDETENPRTGEPYTESDLIDPPDTPKNEKLFKGKKKRNMYVDVLRYCIFIPFGLISKDQKDTTTTSDTVQDIVLDYGLLEYQETEWHDLSNVKFPFKCYTWGYVDGEIMSPVDDAINPQRFINRVLSVAESQINNSGGTNIVVDKDAVDAQGGEDELQRDVDQGKPITIRTKGRGVPNSIGTYDATPQQGTYNLFNIIPIMEQVIQKNTGVNEGLKGESTGSDQLVGVTQLLIQRGSLMQEPFYNALAQVFLQVHQHTATVGKRMYIDNERELAIAAGDDAVEILQLSKDMRNEDFRVFVKRENADEQLFAQGDQMLNVFLQTGLIDENMFADMFGRSTPSDVAMGLREAAGMRQELQRQQAKQAEADKQDQITEFQQQELRNNAAIEKEKSERAIDKIDDQAHELNKIALEGEIQNINSRQKQG